MKLSDFKGEEALDVLADLIEPISEIFSDQTISEMFRDDKKRRGIVRVLLKEHKPQVLAIFAALERTDVETFKAHLNVLTLPQKLMEIMQDKDFMSLFTSQGQLRDATFSGSALENTTE